MDPSQDSPGRRPPPYTPSAGLTKGGDQTGPGGIAVISSSAGPYSNTVHPEPGDFIPAPPDYSVGFEDFNCFDDKAIRRGFIRKVYLTLMIQLLATVGIICAFLYWNELRIWTLSSDWFSYTMMAVVLVFVISMSCCGTVRRKVPLNFLCLGLFTVAEGLMLGSITVYYEAEPVLWAIGATALVSLALSVFAMQSKWDFTMASGCMWAIGWTLLSFALLCGILRSQYVYIVYACLGTLVFSIYLVIDTQLLLGGKHSYSISPEEYIFAALNLYLDIVSLFLLILQLIGICR